MVICSVAGLVYHQVLPPTLTWVVVVQLPFSNPAKKKKKLLRFGKDPLHAAGKNRIGSGSMFTVSLIGSSSNFTTSGTRKWTKHLNPFGVAIYHFEGFYFYFILFLSVLFVT